MWLLLVTTAKNRSSLLASAEERWRAILLSGGSENGHPVKKVTVISTVSGNDFTREIGERGDDIAGSWHNRVSAVGTNWSPEPAMAARAHELGVNGR